MLPRTVIELGAGAGLAGLAAAKLTPASHFVFTDRDYVSLELVESNVELNGVERARTRILEWGDANDAIAMLDESKIPDGDSVMILGSDLIYSVKAAEALLTSISAMLKHQKRRGERHASHFLLCSSFRHPDTTAFVCDMCKALSLERHLLNNSIIPKENATQCKGAHMLEKFVLATS